MIQFLAPFWLFALPLAILPWFFPVFRLPQHPSYLFSAFLFLPDSTRRKRFRFSLEDLILKLLRSLIIVLICLILARPFWQEAPSIFTIWLLDDTFSRSIEDKPDLLKAFQNLESTMSNQPVVRLSELFTNAPYAPMPATQGWNNLTTTSPNLATIGNLILKKFGNENERQNLRVHLISDFQRSQYQFYHAVLPTIEWVFHRPSELTKVRNLSLRALELESAGLFDFQMTGEIYGYFPESRSLQVEIVQQEQIVGTKQIPWQGNDFQAFEIRLQKNFNRKHPLTITLKGDGPKKVLDNTRFFQIDHSQNFWVSIITSEGNTGIYRHGLHQLKSALNANQIFSFVSKTPTDLEQHQPDILLLLGDHPARWAESLKDYPLKLFIPTRFGDWEAYSTQIDGTSPQMPASQWRVDWTSVSFAKKWQIQKINEYLYYSPVWNLWLLATGVSPAWGPLYQDVVFADQVQTWLTTLLEHAPQQFLGTLEIGNPAMKSIDPNALFYHWLPGNYQLFDPKKEVTRHFSLNLPHQESQPDLLTTAQIEQMQKHFAQQQKNEFQQKAIPAVNQLREWLVWGLWGLLFVEVLFLIARLLQQHRREHGKHSFH